MASLASLVIATALSGVDYNIIDSDRSPQTLKSPLVEATRSKKFRGASRRARTARKISRQTRKGQHL